MKMTILVGKSELAEEKEKKKVLFSWNISSNCYNFEATQTLKNSHTWP